MFCSLFSLFFILSLSHLPLSLSLSSLSSRPCLFFPSYHFSSFFSLFSLFSFFSLSLSLSFFSLLSLCLFLYREYPHRGLWPTICRLALVVCHHLSQWHTACPARFSRTWLLCREASRPMGLVHIRAGISLDVTSRPSHGSIHVPVLIRGTFFPRALKLKVGNAVAENFPGTRAALDGLPPEQTP